jgi:hypothetical protein
MRWHRDPVTRTNVDPRCVGKHPHVSSRLRIAIACSKIVDERQRHGRRGIRLDLLNGMRIAALTTVADESRTMLSSGLATARTIASVPSPKSC